MSIFLKLKQLFSSDQAKFEDRYKHLPEEHRFAYDYCMMIHDAFAQTVVQGEKDDIFSIQVKDESGELIKEIEGYQGEDLIDFLESGGRHVEVFRLLYNQALVGILSDMTHFLFESLQCSKKRKMTIAFHLLRKPLTENLLYLEYLLSDPGSFIYNFWKEDMDHFGLGRGQKLEPLKIIKSLYEKYELPRFADAEFIHEVRYDKKSKQSFQTYFQRATHLVTQNQHYKTENTNFNFIYSRDEDIEGQLEGLYTYLPIILFHAYQVVEGLLKLVASRAGEELDVTDERVAIGYVLWEYRYWHDSTKEEELLRLIEVYDISQHLCEKCKVKTVTSHENYLLFYEKVALVCGNCGLENSLLKPFRKLADEQLKKRSST